MSPSVTFTATDASGHTASAQASYIITSGGQTPKTLFGFNCKGTYNSTAAQWYLRAGETAAAQNTRLVNGYGPFKSGKCFPSGIPSNISATTWPSYPSVIDMIICLGWTAGQIASGSQDSALTSLMRSVPSGKYARLCWNEVDYDVTPGSAAQIAYAADMAHMVTLRNQLGLQSTVGIFHCFGEFNLEQGYSYSWVNLGNCDGIVWDCYENKAGTDDDGSSKFGHIATQNAALGITRWCIGEHGDRRPGSDPDAWDTDAHRAAAITARMNTLLALPVPPETVNWFNVVGSSGAHQLKQTSMADGSGTTGPDTASVAAYKAFVTASLT